ncbi:hypothetical protein LCGC14_1355290 [marine sediment metagenome]|uniref:Portal protein n=1 Tax=marine sediment metagenome TaxID=412755 RepID=A0A0F9MQ30_9ZZZZ
MPVVYFNNYAMHGGASERNPGHALLLRDELYIEFQGLHNKMAELERVRYLEGPVPLGASEKLTGLEVRTGMSNDLVEKVKAALTTSIPAVKMENLREGGRADKNIERRIRFWQECLKSWHKPVPILGEIVDAQAGLGLGVPKAVYYPWPEWRKKRKNEKNSEYLDYVKGKKKEHGPPFVLITVHPMTFMPRFGVGNRLEESIEESYKNKRDMYHTYSIQDDAHWSTLELAGTEGIPIPRVRAMPAGKSTVGMVKVTEYVRNIPGDTLRQVFIDDRLVLEEEDPNVRYFPILGRTTSSKDPDKLGVSVADVLRHLEPVIDRTLTRMAEASDRVVRKRLAVELPEGSTDYLMPPKPGVGEDNDPTVRTFEFDPEHATALPPGSKMVDPFEGVENVYGAMPFLQLVMQIASQHGVSPIFEGTPPGASGSGYRDNSLYLMARSQFNYLVENFEFGLSSVIEQMETWIVTKVKRPIWCGPYSLSPKDIKDWPARYEVKVQAFLPQNLMAEAQLYDTMWTKGHVTRHTVKVKGLNMEVPEAIQEERERYLEDLKSMSKPVLFQDVLRHVGILQPTAETQPQLVGPDGKPISGENVQVGEGGTGRDGAQARQAATVQQGTPKEPPNDPGELRGAEGQ